MITLVTTTRDRPLCFSLLERWVERQSLRWDQWLVINDGTEEYAYTMGQQVIARNPASDTLPSICENWLAALPRIKGDRVFVLEDDDYYDPRHLVTLDQMLDEVDLAGISHDVYWKFPTRRFVRMHNENHASLACTAWHAGLNEQVARICRQHCRDNPWIDCYLWVEAENVWPATKRLQRQPRPDGRMLHVGFKLMPGCPGLGIGHQEPDNGSADTTFSTLRQWIGTEAASVYRRLWLDHYA